METRTWYQTAQTATVDREDCCPLQLSVNLEVSLLLFLGWIFAEHNWVALEVYLCARVNRSTFPITSNFANFGWSCDHQCRHLLS